MDVKTKITSSHIHAHFASNEQSTTTVLLTYYAQDQVPLLQVPSTQVGRQVGTQYSAASLASHCTCAPIIHVATYYIIGTYILAPTTRSRYLVSRTHYTVIQVPRIQHLLLRTRYLLSSTYYLLPLYLVPTARVPGIPTTRWLWQVPST